MSCVDGLHAEFINGVYVGRTSPTKVEPYPTFARLFSALVAAAATADNSHGSSLPDDAVAALRWLENNPPEYLALPERQSLTGAAPVRHFRAVGNTDRNGKKREVARVPYIYGSSLDGPVIWGWRSGETPDTVARALQKMCSDVGYLGDNTSKVLLRWQAGMDDKQMTHQRGASGAGAAVDELVTPGRLDELAERYRRTRDTRSIPTKEDTDTGAKRLVLERNSDMRRNVATGRYARVSSSTLPEPLASPWTHAVWVPLAGEVPDTGRRSAADRVHRAMVYHFEELIGERPPPILTGAHTHCRPANNVAVQYIPDLAGSDTFHARGQGPGVLILVPADADEVCRDRILETSLLVGSRRVPCSAGPAEIVDPTRWWDAPQPGRVRLWETFPLAVSDHSYAQITIDKGGEGTEDGKPRKAPVPIAPHTAASRAIRFVLRDSRALHEARVLTAANVAVPDPWVFSRKDPRHTGRRTAKGELRHDHSCTPMPLLFRATYGLSGALPDTAVCAVGRVRHFGSGLLLPLDIDVETI